MEYIKCKKCGCQMSTLSEACPVCGLSVNEDAGEDKQEQVDVKTQIEEEDNITEAYDEIIAEESLSTPPKKVPYVWGMIGVLLVIGLSVWGYLYYRNVYLPEKIDKEAPRYYTFSHLTNMRSSQIVGVEYNKIASLPYGSELITYSFGEDWSSVKSGDIKGFISSNLLLDKEDFYLLNSIWGNTESKECIATSKCRMALLNYFKDKNYVGNISPELLNEIKPNFVTGTDNQWQVFCKSKNSKPNSVYYSRLRKANSKFTDFAVILTNLYTHERRLVLFYFDDDETPHLYYEGKAAAKYIENISFKHLRDGSGRKMLYFKYSNL